MPRPPTARCRALDGATRDMINLAFIAYLIGLLLSGLAAAMLATAVVEGLLDAEIWVGFFTSCVVAGFVAPALIFAGHRTTPTRLTLRSAFLSTVLSGTVVSLFAGLPLELAVGTISFTDVLFEAVSGLTTTGSTGLTGLERAPRGVLFRRSPPPGAAAGGRGQPRASARFRRLEGMTSAASTATRIVSGRSGTRRQARRRDRRTTRRRSMLPQRPCGGPEPRSAVPSARSTPRAANPTATNSGTSSITGAPASR